MPDKIEIAHRRNTETEPTTVESGLAEKELKLLLDRRLIAERSRREVYDAIPYLMFAI